MLKKKIFLISLSFFLIGCAASTPESTNEVTVQQAYYQNITTQAIENLSLLLKEIYPKTHNGLLPNLEDLLMMLNNFELVEKFCEKMKKIPELAEKYQILLSITLT